MYLLQILFMVFCEDLMFYWSHRTLHTPWFYKNIHKVHHEWYNTICISSEYAHPVEFLIGNLIPLTLGAILLFGRAHIIPLGVFVAFRLTETVESHGGYEFPWAMTRYVPMNCTSMYHNYHHLKNIGNFGSMFIIWDSIFGTNSYYYKDIRKSKSKKVSLVASGSGKKDK